ncbi:MAG: hypothetical protein ACREB5_03340 [Sphingomonadaceae bacterium]
MLREQLIGHLDLVEREAVGYQRPEAAGAGILALEDMNVGAADRGRGDPDQRIERSDIRHRLVFEHNAAGLDEDRRFHLGALPARACGKLRRNGGCSLIVHVCLCVGGSFMDRAARAAFDLAQGR